MTMVGSIMMGAGFFSALAHVIGGELSDKIGRRPIILLSLGIRVLMYALMAFLIGFAAPVWIIVIVYFIGQAIGMMERPAATAIITDLSPRKRLTEAFGLIRVGVNLGWAAGPAVGGYLAIVLPYSWLFGVAALVTGLALIIVVLFLSETHTKYPTDSAVSNLSSIWKDRSFLAFTFISLLFFLLMGQMMSTLSIYTVDFMRFSTAQYGLLLTTNGLMVVFLQYPIASKLSKLPKAKLLITGSLLHTLGYLSFGWQGAFAVSIFAMAVITLGEIIHAPASLAVVGELAPQQYRGRYMGIFGLTQILGISISPLLGGIILDAFPFQPFMIWGSIAALGIVAAFGYYLWSVRFGNVQK